MRSQDKFKLKLSKLLLDSNVIIEDYSIENEIVNDPDYLLTNYFCDSPPIRKLTGRKFIKLTIFNKHNE
jgi:hypothetical protein